MEEVIDGRTLEKFTGPLFEVRVTDLMRLETEFHGAKYSTSQYAKAIGKRQKCTYFDRAEDRGGPESGPGPVDEYLIIELVKNGYEVEVPLPHTTVKVPGGERLTFIRDSGRPMTLKLRRVRQ